MGWVEVRNPSFPNAINVMGFLRQPILRCYYAATLPTIDHALAQSINPDTFILLKMLGFVPQCQPKNPRYTSIKCVILYMMANQFIGHLETKPEDDLMQVEEIYQALADVICKNSPAGWQVASISARVSDDFAETKYDLVDEKGKETWFDPGFDDDQVVVNALTELREIMGGVSQPKWSGVKFTLHSNGKFKLDYDYSQN